jgi:hypothetical protein
MILLIYVTHKNEINSLKQFVLDLQGQGGGGAHWDNLLNRGGTRTITSLLSKDPPPPTGV